MRPSQLHFHIIGPDTQLSEQKACKEVSPAYDWLEYAAISWPPEDAACIRRTLLQLVGKI